MPSDPRRSRTELRRGLEETPAYESWRPLNPGPAVDVDGRYAALPLTNKDALRAGAPRQFLPAGRDLDAALATGEAELVTTSGTTGAPTSLVWSQRWWDRSEAASWSLHSDSAAAATGEHRECVLASARCVGPPPAERPRSTDERTLGRLLFLSETADVALWTDDDVRRMARELAQHQPAVLEGDPFYLAAFCARAEELSLPLFRPGCVVLTYGRASSLQLVWIRRAFPVPIASSYGSTEIGYAFVSCERGRFHQNVLSCRVDLVALDGDPRAAKLVITPFDHPFMCLLRYDVGDLARVAHAACGCGRDTGTTLEDILGRVEDRSFTAAGGAVTAAALDAAVAGGSGVDGVIGYQLDQERPGGAHLRVLAAAAIDERAIAERLGQLYGGHATAERVAFLDPRSSGKYPYVRRRPAEAR